MASEDEIYSVLDMLERMIMKKYNESQTSDFMIFFADIPESAIRQAAIHYLDKGNTQFLPNPADLRQAVKNYSEITADEAWARALLASDERNTVVINAAILNAWQEVSPIYAAGDKIGARLAFRSCYDRLCYESPDLTKMHLSLGTDVSKRATAVNEAVKRGILSRERSAALLQRDVNKHIASAAKMIACKKSNPSDVSVSESISKIRDILKKSNK